MRLFLAGAVLVAISGALTGSVWAAGGGAAVALGLLAFRPAVADPAVPGPVRLALRAGLLLLAVAVAVELSGWAGAPFVADPPDAAGLIAMTAAPGPRWAPFLRALAVAACLVLACAAVGLVAARAPRDRLRRIGRTALTVAPLTLVLLSFVALLPEGLDSALGSATNIAVALLVAAGGYAWLIRHQVRRDPTAVLACAGAAVLAGLTVAALSDAWHLMPDLSADDDRLTSFLVPGVRYAEPGPEVGSGIAMAALLVGAALTVPAWARISAA